MEGPPAHYVRCFCSTCRGAWVSPRTRSRHNTLPRYTAPPEILVRTEQAAARPPQAPILQEGEADLQVTKSAGGLSSSGLDLPYLTLSKSFYPAGARQGRAPHNAQQSCAPSASASGVLSRAEGAAEALSDSAPELQHALLPGQQQPAAEPDELNTTAPLSHTYSAASSDTAPAREDMSSSSLSDLEPDQEGAVRLVYIHGQEEMQYECIQWNERGTTYQ